MKCQESQVGIKAEIFLVGSWLFWIGFIVFATFIMLCMPKMDNGGCAGFFQAEITRKVKIRKRLRFLFIILPICLHTSKESKIMADGRLDFK